MTHNAESAEGCRFVCRNLATTMQGPNRRIHSPSVAEVVGIPDLAVPADAAQPGDGAGVTAHRLVRPESTVMGHLIINNAISLNGAFEAPTPPPDGWFLLDPASLQAALEMWQAADAMVMGREVYQGLAAVWPKLASVPGYETFAHRMNTMPKYVASRTLRGPLTWNATLLEGDPADHLVRLKSGHRGHLIATGAGELARHLLERKVVDELRFGVSPYLWPTGPRIFDSLGAIRLELIGTTTFPSGVMHLRYRPMYPE